MDNHLGQRSYSFLPFLQLSILCIISLLQGCSSTPELVVKQDVQKGSLLYGHLSIDNEQNLSIQSVVITSRKPTAEVISNDEITAKVVDNTLIFNNIPPGSYYLASANTGHGNYAFDKDFLTFDIPDNGIYYLGSFRIKLLGEHQYNIIPSLYPSKRDLLNRLLVLINDSSWRQQIRHELLADGQYE